MKRPDFGYARSNSAFTFTELLVVTATVLFLLLMLAPGLAGSGAGSKAWSCLHNQRQLMMSVLMYAQDNAELFPPNPDDGNLIRGHNWCPGNIGSPTQPGIVTNGCLVAPYINYDFSVFRCASDPGLSLDPSAPGSRARSVSMSQAVGTVCATFSGSGVTHYGEPIFPVNGPWLDNKDSHRRNAPYRTYGKLSDLVAPTPAGLWVLIEEDDRSINDASFGLGITTPEWLDYPSVLHNFGCVVAFADGHTELHQWTDLRTKAGPSLQRLLSVPGSPDWPWLSARTSVSAR